MSREAGSGPMRPPALAALALLLAGCLAPPDAPVQDTPEVEWWTPPLLVVADGTYQYHEVGSGASVPAVLELYDLASQAVAHPCHWDGGAYFNNRQVPTPTGDQPVRNGTLRLSFDWSDEDYPFPTLLAGYRAPGMRALAESPRIARGETIEVRIEPGRDGDSRDWALYACINSEDDGPASPDWQPGPFLGSFTVHAEFQPDPEPKQPPAPVEDGRRTSRG